MLDDDNQVVVTKTTPELIFQMVNICKRHYYRNCEGCPFNVNYILHTFGIANVPLANNTACDHVNKIITSVFNNPENRDYGVVDGRAVVKNPSLLEKPTREDR